MQCTLAPESAMVLDGILRTFRCEYITFDTSAILTLHAVSPDFSQLAVARIEPGFFTSYTALNTTVSIPFQRFYRPEMRSLRIDQSGDTTVLEYAFDGFVHVRRIYNVSVEPFEADFVSGRSARADLCCIGKLVERIRDRSIELEIGREVEIRCAGTVMRLDNRGGPSERLRMRVETEPFKSTIHHSNLFTDHTLVLSDDGDVLNVIFRSPDIFLSIFMTTEPSSTTPPPRPPRSS